MFEEIKNLLSDETKWTRGVLARDEEGNSVNPSHPKACQWCLMGAIRKTKAGPTAVQSLVDILGREQHRQYLISDAEVLSHFNDSSHYHEVIELLSAAIKLEEV